jgi:hypothetical protein
MNKLTLTNCRLRRGPFDTMLLEGWDPQRRQPFRSQAFASRANHPDAKYETCWTAAGVVRCKGFIEFPRASDGCS